MAFTAPAEGRHLCFCCHRDAGMDESHCALKALLKPPKDRGAQGQSHRLSEQHKQGLRGLQGFLRLAERGRMAPMVVPRACHGGEERATRGEAVWPGPGDRKPSSAASSPATGQGPVWAPSPKVVTCLPCARGWVDAQMMSAELLAKGPRLSLRKGWGEAGVFSRAATQGTQRGGSTLGPRTLGGKLRKMKSVCTNRVGALMEAKSQRTWRGSQPRGRAQRWPGAPRRKTENRPSGSRRGWGTADDLEGASESMMYRFQAARGATFCGQRQTPPTWGEPQSPQPSPHPATSTSPPSALHT